MTKSERERLEKLYKEMLPREQQELFEYIWEHFGEKQTEPADTEDIISVMQRKIWTPPSPASGQRYPEPALLDRGPTRTGHDS